MNIACLQIDSVWQKTEKNLSQLEASIADVMASKSLDLVVLPELFHAGFSVHPERFAESIDGEVSQCLAGLAKTYGINIVAGVAQKMVRRSCDGQEVRFYNRSLVFNPLGRQIGCYSKQKLFSFAHEQDAFANGHVAEIVEINGEPFALFICYDLRFPELFRSVAKQVKGFIVIANWPESRQTHWETLLRARAIENQCFVIAANRIGEDGNGLRYAGGSCVISPLGELIAYAGANDELMTASVDLDLTMSVRDKFPFLQDLT